MATVRMRAASFLLTSVLLAFVPFAAAASSAPTGLQTNVVFDAAAPLASNAELMRRLLSPLAAAETQRLLARSGKVLAAQAINPAQERFVVYVPPSAPAAGYGLFVFVPPWDEAQMPGGWAAVFDNHGMIFVSAAKSGNDENVLARRIPLALTAEANIVRRYPVDPQRIFVGGFSGGARVAMRIALAYPDAFRGALLEAGSDPLGGAVPIPPAELFHAFQEGARLVYATGANDVTHLGMDAVSAKSMRTWCVFGGETQTIANAGHEIMSPVALSRTLDALLRVDAVDSGKLESCRAEVERTMATQLDAARSLVTAGGTGEARQLLDAIDAKYGGLAAPMSVELEAQLHR